MTQEELQRAKEEIEQSMNATREQLRSFGVRLIDAGAHDNIAGAALVLERMIYFKGNGLLRMLLSELPAAPDEEDEPQPKRGGGKRAPKGQGAHRHKFNAAGVCELQVNGKPCGAKRQRAAKGGAAERPSAEQRTGNLPAVGGAGVEVQDNGDWR